MFISKGKGVLVTKRNEKGVAKIKSNLNSNNCERENFIIKKDQCNINKARNNYPDCIKIKNAPSVRKAAMDLICEKNYGELKIEKKEIRFTILLTI